MEEAAPLDTLPTLPATSEQPPLANDARIAARFLRGYFAPRVAVKATREVEHVCQANHLTFTEMLRPFSRLYSRIPVRDPNGMIHHLSEFQVLLDELDSLDANLSYDEIARQHAQALRRNKSWSREIPSIKQPAVKQPCRFQAVQQHQTSHTHGSGN